MSSTNQPDASISDTPPEKSMTSLKLWWSSLPNLQRYWPILFVSAYWTLFALIGGWNQDHFLIGSFILILGYTGRVGRKILTFTLPLFLTGIVYDSQRYYGPYLKAPVKIAEPYEIEKSLFGIKTAQGILTPNEWWQLNTSVVLDLITGFFYLTFIAIFVLISAYVFFRLSKRGTKKLEPEEVSFRSPAMMWSFFWVNVLGYSTYLWYPAAPPWYIAKYGFKPADPATPADPAGTARFDELLGVEVFQNMYSKSADVFGAIPSLHVAYPLLAVFFCFRFGVLKVSSIIYCLGVSFAAVYLNHHYIIDVIWGWAYAILVGLIIDFYYVGKWNQRKTNPR